MKLGYWEWIWTQTRILKKDVRDIEALGMGSDWGTGKGKNEIGVLGMDMCKLEYWGESRGGLKGTGKGKQEKIPGLQKKLEH